MRIYLQVFNVVVVRLTSVASNTATRNDNGKVGERN